MVSHTCDWNPAAHSGQVEILPVIKWSVFVLL